jgi:hypothetical protein
MKFKQIEAFRAVVQTALTPCYWHYRDGRFPGPNGHSTRFPADKSSAIADIGLAGFFVGNMANC